jgi:glutathione S-transferase
VLETTLSDGREFLVNGEFSVADIAVGYATNFLKMLGVSWQTRFLPPCAVTLACCQVVVPFVRMAAQVACMVLQ